MLSKAVLHESANYPKFPGVVRVPPAPLVHAGFPGNFNLSFSEYEETALTGGNSILDQDRDILMSKVQPCSRFNDIKDNFYTPTPSPYHLGLFHMADVSGYIHLLNASSRRYEIAQFTILNLISFLTEIVGLDKSRLRVSYFDSGDVTQATSGKYTFDFIIPKDPFYAFWIEAGLKPEQMFADNTRNTFLALNIYNKPTPWGYRNEIHYILDNGYWLDIATVENCTFRPIFNSEGNIYKLVDYEDIASVNAVGVERVELASENLSSVLELSLIDKFNKKMVQFGISSNERIKLLMILQLLAPIQLFKLSAKQRAKKQELFAMLREIIPLEKTKILEMFIYRYGCLQNITKEIEHEKICWEIIKGLLSINKNQHSRKA